MTPESDGSKALIPRANSAIEFYQKQIAAAKTPIEDIIKNINANPDDEESIGIYFTKKNMALQKLVATDADEAEKQLKEAKGFITGAKEKASSDDIKSIYEKGLASLARFNDALDRARNLEAMVGKDAAPSQLKLGSMASL